MTEPLTPAETEVYFLLQRYQVRKHYRSSAIGTRYAVFLNGEQVTEPKAHGEARSERDMLTARAIVSSIAGQQ